MGKIILNDIEYGIGVSNGSNVDTTNLIEKDSIVTVIDENVTDEQIPSAKAVYDKLSDLPVDSGSKCYTTLDELGLTADATFQDVVDSLPKGGSALLGVTEFTNYQTIFPYEDGNDQFARVHIVKGTADGSRMYARWFRKDGVKEAIAKFNINNNLFDGWQIQRLQQTYTSLSQLKLTADATIDDVIGALKDGETALITTNEFTNYLTMFPNQCTNDQYAILKVEKKNGNRCFIEWRQKDGNAYAIGGLNSNNQFTNWNNLVRFKKDGFADDSIVCIGDAVSADGVIQTLATLGFSNNILTWNTGVYRVSHVSGLTGLPSELTGTAPAFRLEHHDIKKWGSNHNPNRDTYAQRHSVIYCDNGDIYTRFYESGATAGTYIKDTGWRKIATDITTTTTINNSSTTSQVPTANTLASELYGANLPSTGVNVLELGAGVWKVDSNAKASAYTNMPIARAGKLFVYHLHGNDGSTPYTGTYKYAMYKYMTIDGDEYVRTLNSDGTVGNIVNDTGWKRMTTYGNIDLKDLGLTSPCTTVQIVQAMRDKIANNGTKKGVKGIFNNDNKAISDAPTSYGLLEISAYSNDRLMIRYDGISGSNHDGSYIGKIKASAVGVFSGIEWSRIDNTYSTTEQAIGTWIDGKTIYRKVIEYTFTSDVTGVESQTTIGNVPGIDTLIKAEATIKRLDVKYDYHVPYGKNAQNHGYIVANTSSGSAGSIILYDSAHSVNDIIYAIIEYTKR